ncbi:MAG TPA: TrkA C-terminal domain-containing protein, partial [Anaeromyxobacteraceae bacterium]|nr:TrkA C-terminal domain-containing protein [Anaeromyxobacteraceae bacterium]
PATSRIGAALGIGARPSRWVFLAATSLLAAPFLVGLVRNARRLGLALASTALPAVGAGRVDLAAAPRRVLLALVQLGASVLVLLPVVAVTQPFLPGVPGAIVLGSVILVLGAGFWRRAADLQGHVRAGAQVILEALAKQGGHDHGPASDGLAPVRAMFPGMGEPTAIRLPEASPAAGRTISDLGVRGRTGATILAISRDGGSVMIPGADEVLRRGDVLVLAGSHEAVRSACELLGADGVPDFAAVGAAARP